MRTFATTIGTLVLALGVGGAGIILSNPSRSAAPSPSPFEELMAHGMQRMHVDMAVTPSGDPDRDFAAMMIPHHQGAIDMAKAELAYGQDPVLRRLAQGIIVEQAQEIDVMRRALAARPVPPGADHPASRPGHHGAHADLPDHAHKEITR